jgi:hypothetical protein
VPIVNSPPEIKIIPAGVFAWPVAVKLDAACAVAIKLIRDEGDILQQDFFSSAQDELAPIAAVQTKMATAQILFLSIFIS